MKRFHDRGWLDSLWIEGYFRGEWERCVRHKMEERGEYHPDNVLPDEPVDASLYCD